MAVFFGSNIFLDFVLPRTNRPKMHKTAINSAFLFFLRILAQVVAQAAITIIARTIDALTPGAGVLFEAGATFAVDTFLDFVFTGEVTPLDYGINFASAVLPFISKSFRALRYKAKNRFFTIAEQLEESTLKSKIKRAADTTWLIGNQNQIVRKSAIFDELINAETRAFAKSEKIVKTIENLKLQTTLEQSKSEFAKLSKIIRKIQKGIFRERQSISIATSPLYAAKKTADRLTWKAKLELSKAVRKQVEKRVGALKEKLFKINPGFKKVLQETPKIIPLNSRWLAGLKIIKSADLYDFNSVNAVIYFKPETTNRKKPIFLYQKPLYMILEFLTTVSPGGHYLDNLAWGWEIGKWIRKNNGIYFLSKIPLFSYLANTIYWTYKTNYYFFKKTTTGVNEWLQPDVAQQYLAGLVDNSLKGWNIPYLNPLIHFSRGVATGNSRYLITTTFKQLNKVAKVVPTRKTYYNYKYKQGGSGIRPILPRSRKKWL